MPTLLAPPKVVRTISDEKYNRLLEEPGVEFVGGKVVEKPMSIKAAKVIARILRLFGNEASQSGAEVFSESLAYRCYPKNPKQFRKPDASVIRNERLIGIDEQSGFVLFPADLVVEVISPGDKAEDVMSKVDEYLAHGFKCVWLVYPSRRSMTIHRADGSATYLHENEEVTGEAALPSFRCKVAEFFGPNQ